MAADMEQIEQRLSTLEASLSEVQRRVGLLPTAGNWVEQVSGSLADIPEEDYHEFLKQCRAVRNGDSASDAGDAHP
jgi:prefoldin subunit 5